MTDRHSHASFTSPTDRNSRRKPFVLWGEREVNTCEGGGGGGGVRKRHAKQGTGWKYITRNAGPTAHKDV